MHDPALPWLSQQTGTGQCVWLCDEHFYGFENQLPGGAQHIYICNRYDIVQRMQALQLQAVFSDFAEADLPGAINTLFYRVSKEKPVVHRALNIAAAKLAAGGQLHMCGLKSEGAKNYLDKAAQLLGCAKATRKHGLAYCASLTRHTSVESTLDDSHYPELRALAKAPQFASKPGQFGWQKIDQGSEFLLQTLAQQKLLKQTDSLLDLGCGYGYLALEACRSLLTDLPQRLVLTDNNAAALISAEYNSKQLHIAAEIVPGDCGDSVSGQFQTLLCNPPFHQGFALSQDLTERFLHSAARHLENDGSAFFVVNSFIAVEQKAKPYFAQQETLANNKQFKVIRLSRPRARA
ncbi:class I SAM-dependent methyltransferase [Gilvimarinus sp. DA14]|uniref:class I SAM-dependent methyltransferase n=1 Tax=Gilvimarinus sp. DA14 TaxID=2956798 RepID=UPI0020B88C2D|nr:methyltransferase [Gilvimarinus sp. DA14]UTF61013.1 methyltransferase [Gilvimarinus sp. DA14]